MAGPEIAEEEGVEVVDLEGSLPLGKPTLPDDIDSSTTVAAVDEEDSEEVEEEAGEEARRFFPEAVGGEGE